MVVAGPGRGGLPCWGGLILAVAQLLAATPAAAPATRPIAFLGSPSVGRVAPEGAAVAGFGYAPSLGEELGEARGRSLGRRRGLCREIRPAGPAGPVGRFLPPELEWPAAFGGFGPQDPGQVPGGGRGGGGEGALWEMADEEALHELDGGGSFSPSFSPSLSRLSGSPNGTAEESPWTTASSAEGDPAGGGWGRDGRSAPRRCGLWDKNFAELIAFKQAHGHVVVQQARNNPVKNRLGAWVRHQRKLYSLGNLAEERRARLAGLGFEWDVLGGVWEGMFEELVRYHAVFGNTDVSQSDGPHKQLGLWVCTQRSFRRKGRLRRDREERLARLGLRWDKQQTWEESMQQLMLFRQRTGTCDVPMSVDRMLCSFLHGQRSLHARGRLSAERRWRLERTGVAMSLHDLSWEGYHQAAALFRQHHGHTGFGRVGGVGGRELMDWFHRQWKLQRAGKLRPERRRRMEALGIAFGSSRCKFWEARLADLVDFRATYGHTNVPQDYVVHPSTAALGMWVLNQRTHHKKGALAPDRVERLEAVGFSWSMPVGGAAVGRGGGGSKEGAAQRKRGGGGGGGGTPRERKPRTPRGRKPQARGRPSSSRSSRSRRSDSEGSEGTSSLRPMSPSAEAASSVAAAALFHFSEPSV